MVGQPVGLWVRFDADRARLRMHVVEVLDSDVASLGMFCLNRSATALTSKG